MGSKAAGRDRAAPSDKEMAVLEESSEAESASDDDDDDDGDAEDDPDEDRRCLLFPSAE